MPLAPLSPADAAALLASLEAEHGPDVLARLLGAGYAVDSGRVEGEGPARSLERWDVLHEWLDGFRDSDAFRDAAGFEF